MSRINGLFETHLPVRDLDASITFYRDVLGLEFAYHVPERRGAFFWIGGPGQAMLGLWQGSNVLRMQLHLAFLMPLDDVLTLPAQLRAAGLIPLGFNRQPTDEPTVTGWMPAVSVYCNDPDGHLLEFLSMLPGPQRADLGVIPWSQWKVRAP